MSTLLLSAAIVWGIFLHVSLGRSVWREMQIIDRAVDPLEASICPLHHDRSWRKQLVQGQFIALWPLWLLVGSILSRLRRDR